MESFEARVEQFLPANCRANAERFSIERFRAEFAGYVADMAAQFDQAKSVWL